MRRLVTLQRRSDEVSEDTDLPDALAQPERRGPRICCCAAADQCVNCCCHSGERRQIGVPFRQQIQHLIEASGHIN